MKPWAPIIGFLAVARLAAGISGRVVDENGVPAPAAKVDLECGGKPHRTIAGPLGTFQIDTSLEGACTVSAELQGYFRVKAQPVSVAPGAELRIVLNHERELFQRVEVKSGTSPVDLDRTASPRTLTGLQILDVPYPATRDLRNALKLIPGVVQDGTGGLHFGGSSENQVLYTLDGFQINDPLTGTFATRLSVDAVRSVEFDSGQVSAEFGKGSAGVLSIRTDPGDDQFRYSATNFVPGVDTKKDIHIGTWSPRFGFSGPIKKGRAWFSDAIDGEYQQLVVPDLKAGQDRTSSLRWSNLLRLQVNLTPRNILYADVLNNWYNAPGFALSALDPPSTTINKRARSWFIGIKEQIYIARDTLLEFGYGENRTLARAIPQGHDMYQITPFGRRGNYFVNSLEQSRRGQFLANLFLPSMGTHRIKMGVDLDRLNYSQNTTRTGYEQYGVSGARLHLTTFGGSGVLRRPGAEASFYALDTWRARPNVLVEYGIRQDWDELIRRMSWGPRAAVSWAPWKARSTRFSAGYALIYETATLQLFARPLDQYAIDDGPYGLIYSFYTLPAGRLRAPRSHNATAGFEQLLPKRMHIAVNLLRKRASDGLTYARGIPPDLHTAIYTLSNLRRDVYDSADITVRQPFGDQYEWMASYTRSRAKSNAAVDLSVDQPLEIINNVGPLGWDSPHRFLSWAYLPAHFKNWAIAYYLDARSGFPFSVQHEDGRIEGAVNSRRYPAWFSLNLHAERRFRWRGYRFALRGGFNNITNHRNPVVVNSVLESPDFLHFYGSEGRHFVFRLRFLGKESK